MKIIKNYLLLVLLPLLLFISCKDNETDEYLGNWIEVSDVPGSARAYAVSFSIGDYGYVGGGIDADNNILTDFWKYDYEANNWEEIAEFPGTPRYRATAFAVEGKGYVGTGFDGVNRLNDFWCYDPATDTWEQIEDFIGTERYGAVAMAIDTVGYVGTGYDGSYLKDFYAYYPGSKRWEKKQYVAGSKRSFAVSFVINGKGYICTGVNNGGYEDDLLVYDPDTDYWSELRKISDDNDDEEYDDDYTIIRSGAVAFVLNDRAYITTGGTSTIKSDTWEYDPDLDLWEAKTSFEETSRKYAVAFSISNNTHAFVLTGNSGSTTCLEDIFEFKPYSEYDEDD